MCEKSHFILKTSFSFAEFDVNEKSKPFITNLSEQYHQYKGAIKLPSELSGRYHVIICSFKSFESICE